MEEAENLKEAIGRIDVLKNWGAPPINGGVGDLYEHRLTTDDGIGTHGPDRPTAVRLSSVLSDALYRPIVVQGLVLG